ncbi:hypothetical protein ASN18_3189 [Candidatus Magnetominusculus xianensis]|uniref:Uncharacterized protein n=1 Tax=Candidatus Magnetominusculus xianensis TaxID=1748249 RepID=A0ABR5SBD7_9BACT|nr:hypothetical protein ASN18_3189 [Candidatus Magnetominusculus xianensis]
MINSLYLSKSFINRNAAAMGSFSRPRRFFLKNVMAFLNHLAEQSIQKSKYKTIKKANARHSVNELFQDIKIRQRKKEVKNVSIQKGQ